jgi:DNA-directed RNA polymerase sigma subunit (sigma70/sigma32)
MNDRTLRLLTEETEKSIETLSGYIDVLDERVRKLEERMK